MGIHIMPPLYQKVIKVLKEISYPDPAPEVTSVDGYVYHNERLTWAQIIIAAGNAANDGDPIIYYTYAAAATEYYPNKWERLYRSILLFDTSPLPDNAVIIAAILSIYGSEKIDELGVNPDLNVYSSDPASEVALVGGDFNSLGSTPLCDTPISYANWNTAGYNNFPLNATGRAAISKTGITKLGLRNANYDVAGNVPSWTAEKRFALWGYGADKGEGYKPKLTITYEA